MVSIQSRSIDVSPPIKLAEETGLKAYTITKKVSDLAVALFDLIKLTVKKFLNFLFAEKKVTKINQDLGFFGGIIKDSFELAKQQTELENQPKPMNRFLTYAHEAMMILAPLSMSIGSQNPELSFLKQGTLQVAVDHLKPSIIEFFGQENLDIDQLRRHGMILKGDDIDHAIYQFGTFALATATNALTFGLLNQPLHLLFSVIAGLPPVENAIMSLKVPSYLSEITHKVGKEGKDLLKSLAVKAIEPRMISAAVSLEKTALDALGNQSLPDFGRMGNTIVKVAVQKHIKQPMTEKLATEINRVTNAVADYVVDTTLTKVHEITKSTIELHFVNKAMQTAYMKNPLFGGITLVMAGGMNQSVGEIAVRVTGAALFIMTGQTMWPIIFVYGPRAVNYLIDLKKAYDKVQEEEDRSGLTETVKITEVIESDIAFGKEESIPDPLGFMGGNYYEPVVEAPKPSKEEVIESDIAFGKEESMPDPLGFMGGNYYEPVVEAPKPSKEEVISQVAFGGLMGRSEDAIVFLEEEKESETEKAIFFDDFMFR